MSGPEVEITCGECRTGFDDEAAICESCFKAKQEAVTKLEQRVIDLNEEIAGLQEELRAALLAVETVSAKNDEQSRIINRLHAEVYPRSAS